MTTQRVSRIWARAVLAVAGLLAAAEALLMARRPGLRARIASIERLVDRLRAENELLRARLEKIVPARRPRYSPWQRLRILWHKVRYGLSLRAADRVFVVEPSTLTRWIKAVEEGGRTLLRGAGPVNRLSDLAGELVRLLRFEQPRWGTRRIAQVLARLGVRVSRSSVQRLLRRKPRKPATALAAAAPRRSNGIRPRGPHDVWLIDFTTVKVLFGLIELRVGAVLDAFSRSAPAIGVHWREPSAAWTCRLLRRGLRAAGARPRWVITDQGPQFTSKRFSRFLKARKIRRRYGSVGSPGSIAPIDRLWLTLKTEWSVAVFAIWLAPGLVQKSLEAWAAWYNRFRPHQGLGGRTPEEVLQGLPSRPPRRIEAGDRWIVGREHFAGERTLPIYYLRRAA